MLVINYGLRAEPKVFKLCLLSACYIVPEWKSLTFVQLHHLTTQLFVWRAYPVDLVPTTLYSIGNQKHDILQNPKMYFNFGKSKENDLRYGPKVDRMVVAINSGRRGTKGRGGAVPSNLVGINVATIINHSHQKFSYGLTISIKYHPQ